MYSDTDQAQSRSAHGISDLGELRDIGVKSLSPIIEVFSRHGKTIVPYFDAVIRAMRSGAETLSEVSATETEKTVSRYFTMGADNLLAWKEKVSAKSTEDIIHFIKEEGRTKPYLTFGISYLLGIVLGRAGSHLSEKSKMSRMPADIH